MLNYHKSVTNGVVMTNVNGTVHISHYDNTELQWYSAKINQPSADLSKSLCLHVRYHYRTWDHGIESVDYNRHRSFYGRKTSSVVKRSIGLQPS